MVANLQLHCLMTVDTSVPLLLHTNSFNKTYTEDNQHCSVYLFHYTCRNRTDAYLYMKSFDSSSIYFIETKTIICVIFNMCVVYKHINNTCLYYWLFKAENISWIINLCVRFTKSDTKKIHPVIHLLTPFYITRQTCNVSLTKSPAT